ncbi:MAG: tetratricopeptide repeat protein, partial [Gammaproteobacteria bacterium]
TGIMPSQGSNTKAALTLAKALLKQAGLQQGHILLVTDGIDFDEAESEIDYLGQYRLSILGVGTADGAPIPSGAGGFVKDRNGGIVVPKLDGAELHKAAMAGHGIYRTLSAHDDDVAGLSDFFDSKTQQEAVENSDLRMDRWDDKGPWLLLPVLPLAAFYFRKGLLAVALVMLVPLPKPVHAFEWRDLWQNRNHQAQQAFQAKQYEQAADKFDDPAWKAAAQYRAGLYDKAADTLKGRESADALYNRGNALAQAGQMEEALKAYDKVLAIDPNNEDARQNKDVVEKALEQQKQQQNGEGQSEQNPQDRQQNQDGQQSDSGQSDRKPQDAQDSSQDRQNGQTESSEQRPDQSDQASESSADKDNENERQSPQHAEAEQQNEEQARAQPQSGQQDEKPEGAAEQAFEPDHPVDENQAADEQWLKRIPDDPAGLLRRKFKYQYGQRARRNETEENW